MSKVVPVAIWLVKTHPTLERMILGLYKSVFGFAKITASRPAASAVLNKAPIFPGFSGASATKMSGFVFSFKLDRSCALLLATARIPSVVSRWASFWYTSFEISIISVEPLDS